jgi:hypothetical protein
MRKYASQKRVCIRASDHRRNSPSFVKVRYVCQVHLADFLLKFLLKADRIRHIPRL